LRRGDIDAGAKDRVKAFATGEQFSGHVQQVLERGTRIILPAIDH
jgi:hypothetical protein